MKFERIFLDDRTTVRSGWRFAIYFFSFILTQAVFMAGLLVLNDLLNGWLRTSPTASFLLNGIYLIPALGVGWLCGKYLENVPFRALGASFNGPWLRHLLEGIIIGTITLLIGVGVGFAAGGLRFAWTAAPASEIGRNVLVSFVVFAVAAAFEEALFRGYILQTFARSGLAYFAIILTSAFFGIVHIANPDAGAISTTNTVLAGIWFGVAYLKTRDLWLVWGLHLVWNWLQGSVFGIEVSGLADITKYPLLTEIDTGPNWVTGGAYGLEGGLACTAALVISTIAIHFLPIAAPDPEMLALTSPRQETSGPV